MKKRSLLQVTNQVFGPTFLLFTSFLLASCGSVPLVGGRPIPPSFDHRNPPTRVMVAIQNPSLSSGGALQLLNASLDQAQNKENTIKVYDISGFSGSMPVSIQDFPGQSVAYVYGAGDSSLSPVNLNTETAGTKISGLIGPATSIYISPDFQYVYSANPNVNGGYVTVLRRSDGYLTRIAQATNGAFVGNVSKLALSPGGTTLLIFTMNSNLVYSLNGINGNSILDTVSPVSGAPNATGGDPNPTSTFDRPVNAAYSGDGSFAYVLNCGPECGGTTASITVLNAADLSYVANFAVPGGATFAKQSGNLLYVAGQQLLSSGLLGGMLSVIDITKINANSSCAANSTTCPITAAFPIGDGYHLRMQFGDDNTLWIGARTCNSGVRAAQDPKSGGCVTMVNLSDNSTVVETATTSGSDGAQSLGDNGGLAPVIGLHKTYTSEGGAIHVYNTADGSVRDASQVQVVGYATDLAYIDGIINTQP